MHQSYLKYSTQIDEDIIKAFEDQLHTKVITAKKTTGGEFNYSYIITTDTNKFIARVFRERHSPVDGKLEWIENKLSDNKIPHAKMIFYSRDTKYFPFGYMVSEFLDGKDGFDAIMDNDISFKNFFNKEAKLLKQIHTIETIGFGEIKNGRGEYDNYFDSKISLYEELKQKLEPLTDITDDVHKQVLTHLKQLQNYSSLFKSVLLHGDPPPANTILKTNGELIMIDWDNAKCGSWIDEYTGLVTRGAFMWQHKLSEEERNKIIQQSFRENYKGVDFDDPHLNKVIKIIEILNAYGLLVTHYFQHENMELYEAAKQRVKRLLNK